MKEKAIVLLYFIKPKVPLIVKCIIILRKKKKLLPIEKESFNMPIFQRPILESYKMYLLELVEISPYLALL